MQHSKEYNTLIIVGFWNNAIFTPQWVSKFLLPDIKTTVEFPLYMNGSLRMSTPDLRIFTFDNKFHVSIINKEERVYEQIESIANKIAEYLPHTPVTSFGINFVFESNETAKISPLCVISDLDQYINAGYQLSATTVRRVFKKENRYLNLTINKEQTKFTFDFNYHFDINSLVQFKEKFPDKILLTLKMESMSLLKDFYELEIDAGQF